MSVCECVCVCVCRQTDRQTDKQNKGRQKIISNGRICSWIIKVAADAKEKLRWSSALSPLSLFLLSFLFFPLQLLFCLFVCLQLNTQRQILLSSSRSSSSRFGLLRFSRYYFPLKRGTDPLTGKLLILANKTAAAAAAVVIYFPRLWLLLLMLLATNSCFSFFPNFVHHFVALPSCSLFSLSLSLFLSLSFSFFLFQSVSQSISNSRLPKIMIDCCCCCCCCQRCCQLTLLSLSLSLQLLWQRRKRQLQRQWQWQLQ